MKKIIIVLFLAFCISPVLAQYSLDPPSGIWKIVLKNSGGKRPPPPEYVSFRSNNTYFWGVDSLGTEPKDGGMTGTWLFTKDGDIVMISGDSVIETRIYHPVSDTQYKFDATQKGNITERVHMLEMDIYLEKQPVHIEK